MCKFLTTCKTTNKFYKGSKEHKHHNFFSVLSTSENLTSLFYIDNQFFAAKFTM
jgi:hypothetical protein